MIGERAEGEGGAVGMGEHVCQAGCAGGPAGRAPPPHHRGFFSGHPKPPLPPPQVPADDDRRYHTVITAQGSAVHWQSRVGYYWFLKTKRDCQAAGKCDVSA